MLWYVYPMHRERHNTDNAEDEYRDARIQIGLSAFVEHSSGLRYIDIGQGM